jgi:anti-sigma regulatory factor (Ser/Thr protein kinase)
VEWANDTAVLRVRDRGPGFEWSGAAALPDAMSESGRGLYIVKSLARDLQVRSVDGSGTEAVAWLPVSLNPQLRAG